MPCGAQLAVNNKGFWPWTRLHQQMFYLHSVEERSAQPRSLKLSGTIKRIVLRTNLKNSAFSFQLVRRFNISCTSSVIRK